MGRSHSWGARGANVTRAFGWFLKDDLKVKINKVQSLKVLQNTQITVKVQKRGKKCRELFEWPLLTYKLVLKLETNID